MSMLEPGKRKPAEGPLPRAVLGRWRLPFFYGWIIVGVVFLTEFTSSGMGLATVGLFFTPMKETLGWSLTQLTGAVTATAVVTIGAAPLIGVLLDRFGARPVMVFGGLSSGLGLLFLMGIQEVWQFWVLYGIIGGLGLAQLGQLSGPVVVAKWFVHRRGRAMAVATNGTNAGGLVMAPVIALLIGALGWRSTWGLMGATLLFVVVPPVFLFMRRQPEDMGLLPDGDGSGSALPETVEVPASRHAEIETRWTLREALSTRTLWLLIVAMNLVGLSATATIVHTVPYFTEQEGMSTLAASYIVSLRLLGAFVSRIPWGFVVERVPVRLCLVSVFLFRSLGILSLVVVPYPLNVVSFVILNGALGGALGLLQPMAFADYYGREFLGSIQGAMRPAMALPQLIGPLFVAILFDATGTFDPAFLITSALGFLATALVLLATPPIHRSPKPKGLVH